MHSYGIPLRYYVDSLRVFRFIRGIDSFWRKHILQTDEADSQWRQVMRIVGVDVTFALSSEAKGEVEVASLGCLLCQSHIPRRRISSAYERHGWSTDIGRYLCLIMT